MSRKIATRKRPNRPVEGGQAAGVLFKWEEGGEDWAGVFIDGDVEGLGAAAGVAMGAVAGGADAGWWERSPVARTPGGGNGPIS